MQNALHRLAALLFVLLFASPALAQTPSKAGGALASEDYETALSTVLSDIVQANGLVDYQVLSSAHGEAFHRVIRAIETFDLEQLGHHDAQLAFWMNAYNVHMLKNILDQPDIEDVLANGMGDRFFKTPRLVGGLSVSLDEVEHVILRAENRRPDLATYQLERLDPRIHVGLNCAAVSCPALRRKAFTAKNVHNLLDDAMREFVNSTDHFMVTDSGYRISSLLDWFGSDFDAMGQPAGDFLRGYLTDTHPDQGALDEWLSGKSAQEIKDSGTVVFFYDWTVNRAK